MNIGFVKIYVTDLSKSLEFYTDKLGLKLDYTDKENWAQFESGAEVSLAIERVEADHTIFGSKMVGRYAGVTLMVDDIKKSYVQLMSKGVEFTGEPQKQQWGGILAHLKDLDGNILTIMQEA